jgi:hypothetical protein
VYDLYLTFKVLVMENLLSLLASYTDEEINAIYILLSEFRKNKRHVLKSRVDMKQMIHQRMIETMPEIETIEELEKRKRDVRKYVEYNFF